MSAYLSLQVNTYSVLLNIDGQSFAGGFSAQTQISGTGVPYSVFQTTKVIGGVAYPIIGVCKANGTRWMCDYPTPTYTQYGTGIYGSIAGHLNGNGHSELVLVRSDGVRFRLLGL